MNNASNSHEPRGVEQAREEVVRSRARISETLDQLEGRLVDKKHELRDKLDVKKRVHDAVDKRPLAAVGVAAGVGFLLGILGGGKGGHGDADSEELRELLREARENGDAPAISVGRQHPSFWQEARAQLVGALTAALVTAVAERMRPHDQREHDPEPELGPRRRPPRRRRPAPDAALDELDMD